MRNIKWRSLGSAGLIASCVIVLTLRPYASLAQHAHPAASPIAAPVIGGAAIPFELKTLEGKSAGLETFRGKPLVINFFASWCDPCREEMPLINELAAKSSANYHVLGIAVEDTRAAVSDYVKEARLIFPVALDLNSTVKRSYRIFGPPATFFVDEQGIIRDIVLGPVDSDRVKEAIKKVGIPR
jgi:thiol-disulfide isomerase/thioredoxin